MIDLGLTKIALIGVVALIVIGPEKQMIAYESYLQSKEGADTRLVRLYPRDFWMED